MNLRSNTEINKLLKEAIFKHVNGQLEEACQLYNKIIFIAPDHDEALHLLGVAAAQKGEYGISVEKIGTAITINPTNASYYCNIGNAFFSLQLYDDAISNYTQAIKLKPNYSEAYSNRGNALKEINHQEMALESYDKAIIINPQYSEAYYNKGILLHELRRWKEAIECFKKAAAHESHNEEIFYNLAVTQQYYGDFENSLISYTKAITLNRNYADAYCGRALVSRILKKYTESIADFEKVIEINPNYKLAMGNLLHSKALACDWHGIAELSNKIQQSIFQGNKIIDPFSWQASSNSIKSLMECAKIYAAREDTSLNIFHHSPLSNTYNKIRVGYLSADIGDHATSHLLVGVLENHNKDKFEIFCFDNGQDDGSDLRKRIEATVDNIISIKNLDDNTAAQLIYNNKIDVLVNLNGYFGAHRNNVFAKRPSPIQINFLGFPGTLGAEYMDYIIADKIVLPEEDVIYYAEKVIYMPHSYQPNDRNQTINHNIFSKSDLGLPEDSFVFCCFNNAYKITPEVFDVWMNILRNVDKSILWLLEDNSRTSTNLRQEAELRNVASERLIFAPRIPHKEHLARHTHADLFLDTFPCNAHTTASDALWTSLPILTCSGRTFPSKVTHSLLLAMNTPELVTYNLADYEKKAIELAQSKTEIANLKIKLNDNRLNTPLFDTASYTLFLERSFEITHSNYLEGLKPEAIWINE
jgi:predicted O-linked N-acetylglucosamine transferase (SPINDLY family)